MLPTFFESRQHTFLHHDLSLTTCHWHQAQLQAPSPYWHHAQMCHGFWCSRPPESEHKHKLSAQKLQNDLQMCYECRLSTCVPHQNQLPSQPLTLRCANLNPHCLSMRGISLAKPLHSMLPTSSPKSPSHHPRFTPLPPTNTMAFALCISLRTGKLEWNYEGYPSQNIFFL